MKYIATTVLTGLLALTSVSAFAQAQRDGGPSEIRTKKQPTTTGQTSTTVSVPSTSGGQPSKGKVEVPRTTEAPTYRVPKTTDQSTVNASGEVSKENWKARKAEMKARRKARKEQEKAIRKSEHADWKAEQQAWKSAKKANKQK